MTSDFFTTSVAQASSSDVDVLVIEAFDDYAVNTILTVPLGEAKILNSLGLATQVNTKEPVIEQLDDQEIFDKQLDFLQELQKYQPNRPIKYQYQIGQEHWKTIEEEVPSIRFEVYTSLLLELIFDTDAPSWEENREIADKLVNYLTMEGIPHYIVWTGGKGMHIHVLMSTLPVPEELYEDLQEYQIDAPKETRSLMANKILVESGVGLNNPYIDRRKIEFSSRNNGSMVKMIGGINGKTGNTITILPKIPTERPTDGQYPLKFPQITEWNIGPYKQEIIDHLKSVIGVYKKRSETPLAPIGDVEKLPCYRLMMNGVHAGARHFASLTMSLILKDARIEQNAAAFVIRELVSKMEGTSPSVENEAINTLDSVYRDDKLHFSCRGLSANVGEQYCDWMNCPRKNANKEAAKKKGNRIPITEAFNYGYRGIIPSLGEGEFYYDANLEEYGYACNNNDQLIALTASEWANTRDDDEIEDAINSYGQGCQKYYLLPSKPDFTKEDNILLTDIRNIIHPLVEFPSIDVDECDDGGIAYESLYSSWLVGSYTHDIFAYNPRMELRGVTNSGKGRLEDTCVLMGYHTAQTVSPTPAVMFRIMSWYKTTLILDEIQDFRHDKTRMADYLDIIKAGFDKTPVMRCNGDNTEIDQFDTDSYIMFSVKDWNPPEDVDNRSIVINMVAHRREVQEERPIDNHEYAALRARLIALRLKIKAGLIDTKAIWEKAAIEVKKPVTIDGKVYNSKDRVAEIGRILISNCILAGGSDKDIEDIKKIIALSIITNKVSLVDTQEGRVFYALQQIIRERKAITMHCVDDISTKDVAEQLNKDLINKGDANKNYDVKTRSVTNSLLALGFKLKSGTGNKTYFRNGESFKKVYDTNLEKYGKREEDG